MEIVFKKGKFFKKLIEFSKDLIDIGCLKFNKNGISLNTIDINKCAIITFQINLDAFSKFKVEQEYVLPVKFEYLCKISRIFLTLAP